MTDTQLVLVTYTMPPPPALELDLKHTYMLVPSAVQAACYCSNKRLVLQIVPAGDTTTVVRLTLLVVQVTATAHVNNK
jgi:hypothetical protein